MTVIEQESEDVWDVHSAPGTVETMFKDDLIQFSQELCRNVLLSDAETEAARLSGGSGLGGGRWAPNTLFLPLVHGGLARAPTENAGSQAPLVLLDQTGGWGLEFCVHFSLRDTTLAMMLVWSDESQLLWGVGACSLEHPDAACLCP